MSSFVRSVKLRISWMNCVHWWKLFLRWSQVENCQKVYRVLMYWQSVQVAMPAFGDSLVCGTQQGLESGDLLLTQTPRRRP